MLYRWSIRPADIDKNYIIGPKMMETLSMTLETFTVTSLVPPTVRCPGISLLKTKAKQDKTKATIIMDMSLSILCDSGKLSRSS